MVFNIYKSGIPTVHWK